jgi:uncharacterized membrane protein
MRKVLLMIPIVLIVLGLLMVIAPEDASGEGDVVYQKVYGTITEISTGRAAGEPVPGAEVYVEQEPNDEPMAFTNQSKTDSDGNFELWQIPGQYRIWVKAEGYKKVWKVFTIPDAKEIRIDMEMAPGTDTYSPEFRAEKVERSMDAGSSTIVKFQVKNGGDTLDTFNISINGDQMDWSSMGKVRAAGNGGPYSQSVSNLEDNGVADIEVNITVPEDTEPGNYTFTLRTRSKWEPSLKTDIPLIIQVKASPVETDDDDVEVEEKTPFLGVAAILGVVSIFLAGTLRRRR